jgi:hypothetical protein
MQRWFLNFFRGSRREAAMRSVVAQNRFARRYGLAVLTISINLVMASVVLTCAFFISIRMLEAGTLTMPDELRESVLRKGGG